MTSEERIEAMQGKPTCCVFPGDAALLCALTASAVMYPDTDPCGCPCHKTREQLLKELAEASERATAAEAERDDERNMRVDRSLALNKALGERDQLRAELKRERGDAKRLDWIGSKPRIQRKINIYANGHAEITEGHELLEFENSLREAIDAAMGVAEEPTGGKPE